jgi:hypothetical protein
MGDGGVGFAGALGAGCAAGGGGAAVLVNP